MRKYNTETFAKKIKEYSEEYELISEYINNFTPIRIRHIPCGKIFTIKTPYNIFKYKQCPFCSNKWKRTLESFKQEVREYMGDEYEVVGEYINTNTPIAIKHIPCGRILNYLPREIKYTKRKKQCTFCYGYAKNWNTDYFQQKLKQKYGNRFEVIGDYVNAKTKIAIKCNRCSKINMITPSTILSQGSCPNCIISNGEYAVKEYLINHNIKFIQQYKDKRCKDKQYLRFDFAVFFNGKLFGLIEYDGEQHFQETNFTGKISQENMTKQLQDTIKKDNIKNNFCKKYNIKLLRIKYTEYNNISVILDKYLSTDNTVSSLLK